MGIADGSSWEARAKNGVVGSIDGWLPLDIASDHFLLLKEGDGGVDTKCSEDAGEAVLHLHGALPASVDAMLDGVRGYGPHRRAIKYCWARCGCIFIRERCEVGGCAGVHEKGPIFDTLDDGEVG